MSSTTQTMALPARTEGSTWCSTASGTSRSGRRLLTDGGVLVLAAASLWDTIRPHRNVVAGSARERTEDFEFLLQLVASGELAVVHDETFDLPDIAAAYRRVDSGHKRGNVIVRPWPDGEEASR